MRRGALGLYAGAISSFTHIEHAHATGFKPRHAVAAGEDEAAEPVQYAAGAAYLLSANTVQWLADHLASPGFSVDDAVAQWGSAEDAALGSWLRNAPIMRLHEDGVLPCADYPITRYRAVPWAVHLGGDDDEPAGHEPASQQPVDGAPAGAAPAVAAVEVDPAAGIARRLELEATWRTYHARTVAGASLMGDCCPSHGLRT